MRVAVTGARGFIGRHVVQHLRGAGHHVVELGRAADGTQQRLDGEQPGAELADHLTGCGGVVHLAGRSVDSLATPLTAYLEPNVALTERMAIAAATAGATRIVFSSSRMVYAAAAEPPFREDLAAVPDSFYGLSKLTAEQVLALHAGRTDLTTVSLRVAQVVGPGDGGRGALPRMIEQARRDGRIEVAGSGAAVRDFVDVRDVSRAVEAALTASAPPPVVNIGTGGNSLLEMAAEVARQCGLGPGAVQHCTVDLDDRSAYRLDCSLAASELGWTPDWLLADMVADRLVEGRPSA